jgi:hypothetical protein
VELLEANKNGSEWIEDSADAAELFNGKNFTRKDGTAVARWSYSPSGLVITDTGEVLRRESAEKKKAEDEEKAAKKRADGF